MPKKEISEAEQLLNIIIEGILKKKGSDIISLDLSNLPNSVSHYFILCHAGTEIQVRAIAEAVVEETNKQLGVKPWHREGVENAEWILIDFVDVVVHIFKEETRSFYNLEKLWADAQIKHYKDN